MFRTLLTAMGEEHLMDNGDYALIYVDSEFNWRNVYHAMNHHFFRSKSDSNKSLSAKIDLYKLFEDNFHFSKFTH